MQNSIILELVSAGVDTILPISRDSGYLDYIERGATSWDNDTVAYWTNSDGTVLEWNLALARRPR